MRTIVLWDIDNTLLYTGGAGSIGMTRAFRDLYGINDGFSRIEFSGAPTRRSSPTRRAPTASPMIASPPSSAASSTRTFRTCTARCAKRRADA
jgi:hypothetical protein